MTGKISLTASMRSNLLSLQNISRQVSATQNKLATGNKVNSAIDNPSSYYTARALNNRADDLNALLDSMGQAISTIKAATTALETGAAFLEQAAAVATQALETNSIPTKSYFESQENVVAVVSDWGELKAALDTGKTGNIVIYGNIKAQDTITLKAGQNLVGIGYFGVSEPDTDKFSQLNFDLEKIGKTAAIQMSGDSQIIADISIKAKMRHSTSSQVIMLRWTKDQVLENVDIFMDVSNQDISIPGNIVSGLFQPNNVVMRGNNFITSYAAQSARKNLSAVTGNINLEGNLNISLSPSPSSALSGTINLFGDSHLNIFGEFGLQSATVNAYDNSEINLLATMAIRYSTLNLNDAAKLNINANVGIYAWGNDQVQDMYATWINMNSSQTQLNLQGERAFSNPNGRVYINAAGGSEIGINHKIYKAEQNTNANKMDYNTAPEGFKETETVDDTRIPNLEWLKELGTTDRMADESESNQNAQVYQNILRQYDDLIKDASYKGINLLQNDKLGVNFNENRSANLNVQGKDMSSAVLGLATLAWQTQGDIAQSLGEISAALKSIRSFSAELGNNYSIITSRQDFTENLINILTEGADKLTLADMNEESANMLALQTRQQLAVNSLSLASQASQSVLRLF